VLTKEKREELVRIYLQHGRGAIEQPCQDLGISTQSIVSYGARRGMYRAKGRRTDNDARWARAIAIGRVVA